MKIYFRLILIALPFMLFSCNKWLDVEPKSQVRDSDLFSSESGFKEALSGVYSSLTYEPLYGREMTFGLMGVLGYEWDYQAPAYDPDKIYEYQTSQTSLNRIDAIWNGLYNSVTNDNKLLEEIDAQKSIFTGDNYAIIKGEALALRAFIHFDLLRTFGASYEENPQKIAIPYYTKSSKEIAPQLTVTQVIDLALADLNEAANLLKSDPILTGKPISLADDNGYLMNRQVHLNYFAVKGLLARIYLYKKEYAKALENATEVINSTKFPWVLQANLVNKDVADLTFSTEHLFALNVVRLKTIYENSFTTTGASSIFYMTQATRAEYYENDAVDFRYLYLYTISSSGNYFLNKYNQLESTAWPVAYRNKMPMIKLTEMYFIAAEAQKLSNITAAANMINQVRLHRGLTATTINTTNFDAVLVQEFRKEFIGEGQLFFFHKRKNNATIPRSSGLNLIALKGYKLPIPLSEFSNSQGRVDNR
ncbi:RagB/SusD family nutrient uptake outer membrane protein [Pedobacter sp. MW01-1-1]|uniref:RagB/SusD family nutrient uptake outer membrane protein n=1 Tax=Pedobacter sp. MW01-1-1 TaxID=3383027 RepID=UPI003FED53A6